MVDHLWLDCDLEERTPQIDEVLVEYAIRCEVSNQRIERQQPSRIAFASFAPFARAPEAPAVLVRHRPPGRPIWGGGR